MVGSLIFSEILLFFFHISFFIVSKTLGKIGHYFILNCRGHQETNFKMDTYYAFYDGMKKLQLSLGIRRQIQNILLHLVKNICLSILNWLLYLMRPIQWVFAHYIITRLASNYSNRVYQYNITLPFAPFQRI